MKLRPSERERRSFGNSKVECTSSSRTVTKFLRIEINAAMIPTQSGLLNTSGNGDVPVTRVLLRIVTVLVSVFVALVAASYASASFDYEISSRVYEGTPIPTIVFVSVFLPLLVLLVATGALVINRTYRTPPADSN